MTIPVGIREMSTAENGETTPTAEDGNQNETVTDAAERQEDDHTSNETEQEKTDSEPDEADSSANRAQCLASSDVPPTTDVEQDSTADLVVDHETEPLQNDAEYENEEETTAVVDTVENVEQLQENLEEQQRKKREPTAENTESENLTEKSARKDTTEMVDTVDSGQSGENLEQEQPDESKPTAPESWNLAETPVEDGATELADTVENTASGKSGENLEQPVEPRERETTATDVDAEHREERSTGQETSEMVDDVENTESGQLVENMEQGQVPEDSEPTAKDVESEHQEERLTAAETMEVADSVNGEQSAEIVEQKTTDKVGPVEKTETEQYADSLEQQQRKESHKETERAVKDVEAEHPAERLVAEDSTAMVDSVESAEIEQLVERMDQDEHGESKRTAKGVEREEQPAERSVADETTEVADTVERGQSADNMEQDQHKEDEPTAKEDDDRQPTTDGNDREMDISCIATAAEDSSLHRDEGTDLINTDSNVNTHLTHDEEVGTNGHDDWSRAIISETDHRQSVEQSDDEQNAEKSTANEAHCVEKSMEKETADETQETANCFDESKVEVDEAVEETELDDKCSASAGGDTEEVVGNETKTARSNETEHLPECVSEQTSEMMRPAEESLAETGESGEFQPEQNVSAADVVDEAAPQEATVEENLDATSGYRNGNTGEQQLFTCDDDTADAAEETDHNTGANSSEAIDTGELAAEEKSAEIADESTEEHEIPASEMTNELDNVRPIDNQSQKTSELVQQAEEDGAQKVICEHDILENTSGTTYDRADEVGSEGDLENERTDQPDQEPDRKFVRSPYKLYASNFIFACFVFYSRFSSFFYICGLWF